MKWQTTDTAMDLFSSKNIDLALYILMIHTVTYFVHAPCHTYYII